MPKHYIVRLSQKERQALQELVTTGKAAAYKIKHANILLNIDINNTFAKLLDTFGRGNGVYSA